MLGRSDQQSTNIPSFWQLSITITKRSLHGEMQHVTTHLEWLQQSHLLLILCYLQLGLELFQFRTLFWSKSYMKMKTYCHSQCLGLPNVPPQIPSPFLASSSCMRVVTVFCMPGPHSRSNVNIESDHSHRRKATWKDLIPLSSLKPHPTPYTTKRPTKTDLWHWHPVMPFTDLSSVLLFILLDSLSEVFHIFAQHLMLFLKFTEAKVTTTIEEDQNENQCNHAYRHIRKIQWKNKYGREGLITDQVCLATKPTRITIWMWLAEYIMWQEHHDLICRAVKVQVKVGLWLTYCCLN